jgi:hypothetical protein
MKNLLCFFMLLPALGTSYAQSPVGKWKIVAHTSVYEGQTMDTHEALLKTRPCADKIFYEVNRDGTYRLNAASSGCDDSYKKIQEKLYSKSKWKVEAGVIHISATNFAVSQLYKISFSGNKMIWNGTDGQGSIVYQKL